MGTTASGDDVEGSTTSGNNEGVVKAPHTSADMAPGQSSSKTKGGTANASTDSTNAQAPHGASVDGPRGTDSANSSPTAAGNHAPKKGLADPVDAWTGHVFETVQDLCIAAPQQIPTKTLSPDLPGQSGNGAWPFGFTRHYDSGAANESLPFGPGWSHGFDQFIFETAGRLSCRRPDGRYLDLGDALIRSPDRPQRLRGANLEATRQGDYIYLRELRGSRTYTFTRFPNQKLANCWWLTAITDARGNGIDLYYDRTGSVPSLSRVMDRRGWSFLLEYDQTGRISAVCLLKSAAGGEAIEVAKTRYEYHEAGELARVVDADSIRTEYIYDGFHRLSKARFPLGLEVNWQYDAGGFCKKTSGSGGYYHRELTRTSLDCTVATGNSSAEEFHFGPQGQLLIERALDDRLRTEREYDEDLFVTKQANAAGETWEYEYDSLGNKTREVDPAGNVTQWSYWPGYASIKSDAGQFTEAWYDDFGDLIRTRDRGGEERYFARDQQGRITAVYAGSADPNDRGVLLEKRFYDEQGLLLYREDARGLRTSYQYDALGYVAQRTDTFGDGRASRTWTYQHDVYGRLLVQTFPDGSAERFEHTAHGLVTRSVDAAGRTTHSTYSTTGKLLSRRRPDGAEWHYRYDLEDRLASITNPRGEEHSYRYNLSGQLTGEDTFDGRKLSYSYDLAGRVQRIERSDGTYREFTYDPLGNVLEETTSSGKLTFERDSHGRVMKATAEDAQATIETHFERDTLGRVICERIGPTDEFELRWAYDSRGRVKSRTALGERTEYEYDVAGDLCAVVHHPKGGVAVRTHVQRNIDGLEARRLAETLQTLPEGNHQIIQAPFAIDSQYDVQGHLAARRVVVPDGLALAPNRAARYQLPPSPNPQWKNASERRFSYDNCGRLSRSDDAIWGGQRFRYDAADRLDTAERERLVEHYDYDAAGSVDASLRTFDGQPLWGHLPAPAAHDATQAQLPLAADPALPPDWFKALGSPAIAYTDRGNKLIRHGYYDYENDALGRLVARRNRQSGETTEFEWDVWDQLREVRRPDGYRVRFDYDAWGRRVRKRVLPPPPKPEQLIPVLAKLFSGEELDPSEAPEQRPEYEVAYLWDEDELCGEKHGSGWQRVHVHVAGHAVVGREHEPSYVPFIQSQDGQVYQVIVDHLGTPKELLRTDGSIVWSAAHSAWGETLEVWRANVEATTPLESPFRLQGQYWDHETGLSCTRYRYFDNSLGRWLSPDPLGTAGGYNLLGFNGAPTLVSDPLGLKAEGKKGDSGDPSVESPGTRREADAGRQDPPNTYRDKNDRLRIASGEGKGQFAKDPHAGGADKPTHHAKEGPYGPAEGKKIKLPDDADVKLKDGSTKKAKQAAEDRKKHLDEAQKSRDKEAKSKKKAEEARKKGDDEAAAKHDADAAKHESKAKKNEQAAREHSEALGDAATDHAVKEMFPPPKEVTPVKKGQGANTFDNVYKVNPPPPDYVIAESKGGAGTNSSSRKGDNPGERYEQGTPEYRNQLLEKQGEDVNAPQEQRDMALDVRNGEADADYIKVTQPFDKNGDLKETKVSEYDDQSYDADGNPHPRP